jgi:hypothetical protein
MWCHPQNVVASACHHKSAGATVAGEENCDDVVLSAAAFLPEEVLRGVSSSIGQHAVPVPRYEVTPSTIEVRLGRELERDRPLETRPLETSLRI